jgi:hypothetical protein
MKIYWLILSVFIALFPASPSCPGKKMKAITPVLSSEFGKIISVFGAINRYDHQKSSSGENRLYIKIQRVDDEAAENHISCVGFDSETDNLLVKLAGGGKSVSMIGYETIVADGLPKDLKRYVAVPAATNYSINHNFIVVKINMPQD